jgi:hypothetical protein
MALPAKIVAKAFTEIAALINAQTDATLMLKIAPKLTEPAKHVKLDFLVVNALLAQQLVNLAQMIRNAMNAKN